MVDTGAIRATCYSACGDLLDLAHGSLYWAFWPTVGMQGRSVCFLQGLVCKANGLQGCVVQGLYFMRPMSCKVLQALQKVLQGKCGHDVDNLAKHQG